MVRGLFCAVVLAACGPRIEVDEIAVEDCAAVCGQLVDVCAVASYPNAASCQAGCLSGASLGADTTSQRACVDLAECDLFALLECEHDFGA